MLKLDPFAATVFYRMSIQDAQMLTALLVHYLADMEAWYDEERHVCQWCGEAGKGGSRVAHLPNCPILWLTEHQDSLHQLMGLMPPLVIRPPTS